MLERVSGCIQQVLQPLPDASEVGVLMGGSQLRQRLQLLSDQLKGSDGAAVETWQDLSATLQRLVPQPKLQRLTGLIEQFDFERASRALDSLTQHLDKLE